MRRGRLYVYPFCTARLNAVGWTVLLLLCVIVAVAVEMAASASGQGPLWFGVAGAVAAFAAVVFLDRKRWRRLRRQRPSAAKPRRWPDDGFGGSAGVREPRKPKPTPPTLSREMVEDDRIGAVQRPPAATAPA
jgi:hypothetical protein